MSGIVLRKKEGETPNALVYRFIKKVQQGGIIKEVKNRRFLKRKPSKTKIRASAAHRSEKALEVKEQKKLGLM